MNDGDIVVAALRQADGSSKARPALCWKRMPPFQDVLVCGVSTRLQHMVTGFEELITPGDPDFPATGLRASSIFRLGYLAVLSHGQLTGRIGNISSQRLNRLLTTLAEFLRPKP